MWDPGISMGI